MDQVYFPLTTLNEFAASSSGARWLDSTSAEEDFSSLKPKLIDDKWLQSRAGFTRLFHYAHHIAVQSHCDVRQCSDILQRLNIVAVNARANATVQRAALFLARNLFTPLLGHVTARTEHARWNVVCAQCVEQWHQVLKQCADDEVHRYLQPAVLALISTKLSNALISSTAQLMCTMWHVNGTGQDDDTARTQRALLVQQLIEQPQCSAVLIVFFDKVMQSHRAWALHWMQHIVAALKGSDSTTQKNRKDSATHLMSFVRECCERDKRAVALFTEDWLSLYTTATSPTRRLLVDVLLTLAHDWSLLSTLTRDPDAHIRARAVGAAVECDAASLNDRLCTVTAALRDDSKVVRLQAVKSLQRLHDTCDRTISDECWTEFYASAMPELYRLLNVHPASEKWSKDVVRAIEQLMCNNIMVELHRLLPCFAFHDEMLSGSVSRIISSALRLPGESTFALYAAVSLSLLAARLNAHELELFEHMIAHMMRAHDSSVRELISTLFAVFFEPSRHLQSFVALLEHHDVRRHTVQQSQSSTLRLGSIIVLTHLTHSCEAVQFIAPLVQYLEEFALQSQSRALNAAQLEYFQRINNYALQVLVHSSAHTSHAAINEFCDEYLLALIKLGNVRASVKLLYALHDRPIERGATLLHRYEEALKSSESVCLTQMCRFVELVGELMAHMTPHVTRVVESAVQGEQDYKDELTRRHVIDEHVTHAVSALTGTDEFFARYVPLVAECVVSDHAPLRGVALLTLGRIMTTSLALTQHYLPLLHELRDRSELIAEVLVIYADLIVLYPRHTAPLLAELVRCLDDGAQSVGVQHTSARVLSALALHRLIKQELVLPSLARQLLHADTSLAALALAFFAQLAARESSVYTRHVQLIYNELQEGAARVSIVRSLLQYCREAQKTELAEVWSSELSADRAQLLSTLLPSVRSLALLQRHRTTQPQLCAALVPHLLLGKQRGSLAVKTLCSKLLTDVAQQTGFEE